MPSIYISPCCHFSISIVKFFITVIVFIYAYKSGKSNKKEYLSAIHVSSISSGGSLSESMRGLALEDSDSLNCPESEPPLEIEEKCPVYIEKTKNFNYGKRKAPDDLSLCGSLNELQMPYFHKHPKAYTMDKIFPHIHHASSMANVELFMTLRSKKEWYNDLKKEEGTAVRNTCSEIYLTRTGGRASQPNKCVAVTRVPEGSTSYTQLSHRKGITARMVNQYQNDYSRDYSRAEEGILLAPLLERLDVLIQEFKAKIGPSVDSQGQRRAAVVMVANEGVMDLLLNFVCSCTSSGIDTSTFIVFVGREEYVTLVESMGIKAMYSAWLGAMPTNAAKAYLDKTFSRMMWFKMVSVYIAIASGFDVLFQDVDLIWLKDPIPILKALPGDMSFMDDGARTPRYTPYFVNSGFFYLKYNQKTLYFQEKMMKCAASEIGYTHSHQAFMIRQLAEAAHLYGIDVFVLDLDTFPSGVQYHHNKGYMKKIRTKTFVPNVFHMCWTDNRVDKVRYFKIMDMWYLPESKFCTDSKTMLDFASLLVSKKQDPISKQCCQPTGWHTLDTNTNLDPNNKPQDYWLNVNKNELELHEKCLTASFSSSEWYQNCDRLFIHDRGAPSKLATLVKQLKPSYF